MVGTSAWHYAPPLSIWTSRLQLDTRECGGGGGVSVGVWQCEMCTSLVIYDKTLKIVRTL